MQQIIIYLFITILYFIINCIIQIYNNKIQFLKQSTLY